MLKKNENENENENGNGNENENENENENMTIISLIVHLPNDHLRKVRTIIIFKNIYHFKYFEISVSHKFFFLYLHFNQISIFYII